MTDMMKNQLRLAKIMGVCAGRETDEKTKTEMKIE